MKFMIRMLELVKMICVVNFIICWRDIKMHVRVCRFFARAKCTILIHFSELLCVANSRI